MRIGGGSYGEVWMARTAVGTCHAVKIVYRKSFDHDHPYEREFGGIKKFEPISRSHPNLVAVLHVGRNDAAGYFYYVMELADDGSESRLQPVIATEGPARRPVTEPDRLKAGLQTYTPRTLRSELSQRGRLSVEECLELGLALTDALALRLYERRKDQPLWSEAFSGKTNEVVALERRALDQLAARLRLKISTDEQRQIDQLLTNNLEALGWYRQAQAVYILKGGTPAVCFEVMNLVQKSLTLDPRYLDADFFDAYMSRLILQDRHPTEIRATLERRTDEILHQDDTHIGALDFRAGGALVFHGNWEDFDKFYEQKLQSLSGQEWHTHRAWGLRLQGRLDEARVEQEKAEHPEPTDPDALWLMCSSRWLDRHYDVAIRLARRILELYPGHMYGSYWLAHCLVAKGDYEAGIEAIAQAQDIWKRQELTALLGYAYARMGQPDKAREVLKELLELKNSSLYLQPYFIARVYAALGEKKEALDWLEKAVAERSEYLFNPDWGGLRTGLAWDDLQGEPRYWQLCERVGLGKDQWPRPKLRQFEDGWLKVDAGNLGGGADAEWLVAEDPCSEGYEVLAVHPDWRVLPSATSHEA